MLLSHKSDYSQIPLNRHRDDLDKRKYAMITVVYITSSRFRLDKTKSYKFTNLLSKLNYPNSFLFLFLNPKMDFSENKLLSKVTYGPCKITLS